MAQTLVLAAITSLKKLCNHPSLLVDNGKVAEGFEEAISMLPPDAIARPGRGPLPPFDPSLSGKFHVLHKLLKGVRATSDDKVVLVSNYTQTLDLFERMCQQEGWQSCKLDGSCNIKKRARAEARAAVCRVDCARAEARSCPLLTQPSAWCELRSLTHLPLASRSVLSQAPRWSSNSTIQSRTSLPFCYRPRRAAAASI